ncbi:hypothetical protein NK553_27075 [Pseudomonas sp. ZM23]|uniref:Uncharacterized protein n=1 Tax=Pseudomonas triclosanedens TaxID=2961893 RepID=A0ABY6ZQA8_9PSED|nr:hypothetical protein [Pseudomonas triclosanedens]MCP8467621.1 hypothetical protein [Pseudomonas triclosanedens]MCP8473367.1 hypothetical protein [Pseudomonas triclosanedens]MCP8479396.1 hypothetical protein [Pseudomonas triclosanedens]WAI47089.1 hypothetical protein OU419_15000 [Pseudomonas triclosanedens]
MKISDLLGDPAHPCWRSAGVRQLNLAAKFRQTAQKWIRDALLSPALLACNESFHDRFRACEITRINESITNIEYFVIFARFHLPWHNGARGTPLDRDSK